MTTNQEAPKESPPSGPEKNNSVAYDYQYPNRNLRHQIVRSEPKDAEKR